MAREMRDSGIEWIGEIPASWQMKPHKYVMHKEKRICEQYNGEDIISLTMNGVIVRDLTAGGKMPTTFDGYQYVEPEDLLLCLFDIDVTPRCVGLVHNYGLTSPAYSCFKVHSGYHNAYYDYLLRFIDDEKAFIHLAKNLRSSLTETDFGAIKTLVPPYDEQIRIAEALDHRCVAIDAIIEKTKATIEEYKALKQSVIAAAVTKGVRGHRPMKDSGIEWIGEIPAEWEVAKVKYSVRWKSVKGQPEATVLSLYRDYGVIPKDSRDDNHNVTSLDTSGYKVVSLGDFVINKMKAWQGSMAVSEYEGIVSPAYHVCEIINPKLYKRYFHHLMRNHLYLPEYARLSTGLRIGQWDLGFDDFKNLPFIIPPIEEQHEIVEFIETGMAKYDELIDKKVALLVELENYKKTVIYEYVTGKKEVPIA